MGGGAVTNATEFSLSDITLRWMVREVVRAQCGVAFDEDALKRANIPVAVLADVISPLPESPTEQNGNSNAGHTHDASDLSVGQANGDVGQIGRAHV